MNIIEAQDITARDIRDAVNKEPGYLKRANAQYYAFLDQFGIAESDAYIPVNQIVKEVLIQYVSMLVVKDLMGYSYRQVADGVEEDPMKVKYDVYKADYKTEKAKLSYDILAKRKPQKGTASGRIFRT